MFYILEGGCYILAISLVEDALSVLQKTLYIDIHTQLNIWQPSYSLPSVYIYLWHYLTFN